MEGFGKRPTKSYGKFQNEPDNWPDTISWRGVNGPTNVRLLSCNEIIQFQSVGPLEKDRKIKRTCVLSLNKAIPTSSVESRFLPTSFK